jgi:excisionase family DNA binding protein
MNKKAVFTTFEVAKLCHVSPLSIINWVNAGRLAAFRTPGGHRRIRREDLFLFMRDNQLPIPDELKRGSARRRVLIVEEERNLRDALAHHLTSRSRAYDVTTAATPFDAGRLLASQRPDVVVLDVRMPGLEGTEVCRTIKADAENAGTVIIATAVHHSEEAEARLVECGAACCLTKPLDPAALSEFIDNTIDEQDGTKSRKGRSARA